MQKSNGKVTLNDLPSPGPSSEHSISVTDYTVDGAALPITSALFEVMELIGSEEGSRIPLNDATGEAHSGTATGPDGQLFKYIVADDGRSVSEWHAEGPRGGIPQPLLFTILTGDGGTRVFWFNDAGRRGVTEDRGEAAPGVLQSITFCYEAAGPMTAADSAVSLAQAAANATAKYCWTTSTGIRKCRP
jgi:hypothetical protein